MHWAALLGNNAPVVKVLLDAGADPRAKTKAGRIPVELIPDDSPLRSTGVYWRLLLNGWGWPW
ncbi:MAG: ankyrin repeat domain-containing protein [Synechococcus sp. SB0662_bin_45]|nr:ankyrin repeat domain-containing protein [Synechococcus sp. SB0668_bin_13]MXX08956.1 ankyrin repeat domain-containing protein [Synechococcus sp. SB0667_bin_8]MXY18852.1 ankyrin repeat domain-containing protein [Synechococcus sp. SB0664_bin_36]MYE21913.1 ankyrin repeat domain-containing protein [Synechococcus sp. SB0662_bin_45]MYG64102.1 ankyrin repeat domain-containing protein [Synechococcus sp. SB0675_bin_7]MYI72248.1 ankyrin repeat domain-containing protein [Synechococcus sp. SB0673_bin_1